MFNHLKWNPTNWVGSRAAYRRACDSDRVLQNLTICRTSQATKNFVKNHERLWCQNWWFAPRNEVFLAGESYWSSCNGYWGRPSPLLDTNWFYLWRRDRHLADSALRGGEKTTNHSIDILVLLWFEWKTTPCTTMTSSQELITSDDVITEACCPETQLKCPEDRNRAVFITEFILWWIKCRNKIFISCNR